MKWIKILYGKSEAIILLVLGLGIGWFTLTENYGLLMNIKFKWLTITGCVMLILFSIPLFFVSNPKDHTTKILFGILIAIVLIGKPYIPGDELMMLQQPELSGALYESLDLEQFPIVSLQDLLKESDDYYIENKGFTLIGIAKRLDTLKSLGSFAIVTPLISCCAADAYGIGLRIPYKDLESIQNEEWIFVSGKLELEQSDISIPNFRTGIAMFCVVDKTYILQSQKVIPYDLNFNRPSLIETLQKENFSFFNKLVEKSGALEDLDLNNGFTAFLPVDQGLEELGEDYFNNLSNSELKRFVLRHFIIDEYYIKDMFEINKLETISLDNLVITKVNGSIIIDNSRILFRNQKVKNGVIHYIYPPLISE